MDARYPIRPVTLPELPDYMRVAEHAFNSTWPAEQWREWEQPVFEAERSLAAYDGDEIIGTTDVRSFELTVPGGGHVGCAGVTGVGVLPSHRRRGVLSSLMTRQLADIAAGDEPVAALFASEASIYGRYGYGMAAGQLSFTIKRGEAQLRLPDKLPELKITAPKEVANQLAEIHDTIRASRPGMLTRNKAHWDLIFADPEFTRDGSTPKRCVLAEDASGARGYAMYSIRPHWPSDGIPSHVLTVHELMAVDQDAAVTLWADLFSRDLVAEVRSWSRPVDDPLLHQLPDPRRARISYIDGLWIRLIDLPEALTRRSYACPVDLIIEVIDDRIPANAGRWRLQAGGVLDPAKPTCEPAAADPDLTLPVSALGAAYLGDTRLGSLAQAGVIAEHRLGAVAALSAAMWWDPAPWTPTHF